MLSPLERDTLGVIVHDAMLLERRRERWRAANARKRIAHPEKEYARWKQWADKHRDEINAQQRRRRKERAEREDANRLAGGLPPLKRRRRRP